MTRTILAAGLLVLLGGAARCRIRTSSGGQIARSVATAILNAAAGSTETKATAAPVRVASTSTSSPQKARHRVCPKSLRQAALPRSNAIVRETLTHRLAVGITRHTAAAVREVRCSLASAKKAA